MMSSIEHLVVMGVSGVGKTTVAERLSAHFSWPFADADDFHPAANVAKMASGLPLTSLDREPWLRSVRTWMDDRAEFGESTIVACSALRRDYRRTLGDGPGSIVFIHLAGDAEAITERIGARSGHFMPASLLDSQFGDLEPLAADEPGITIDVSQPVDVVVRRILDFLETTTTVEAIDNASA
jgi:gluconokinase